MWGVKTILADLFFFYVPWWLSLFPTISTISPMNEPLLCDRRLFIIPMQHKNMSCVAVFQRDFAFTCHWPGLFFSLDNVGPLSHDWLRFNAPSLHLGYSLMPSQVSTQSTAIQWLYWFKKWIWHVLVVMTSVFDMLSVLQPIPVSSPWPISVDQRN